ncbi:MAG TPA: tyrosine-type recombinase/integrase [Gemmatimonadaceae bacterium]|nr:tyrosine-type recombinase/integrase [Gemmatimonadaceae bacterium]
MPRKRKAWSKVIEEAGVAVRIYERAAGSLLYREVRLEGRKDRRSLGHRDRTLAEDQARQLARRIAELRFAGHRGHVTLGQVLRLYFQHRGPLLSAERRGRATRLYAPMFTRHLGDDFPVENLSQSHLDAYIAARKSGALKSPTHRGVSTTPRDGTLRSELIWLKSALHWAQGHRVGGRRLLTADPFAGLVIPREKNPKRPIASEDRYRRTLAVADSCGPPGQLRCMLALARYTGRRINAICHLRASDVLLTRERVLAALADAGQDERLADYMPQGAIRWRAEHDKLGFLEITPIGSAARAELERYLREHPRVGDAPLFSAINAPDEPVHKNTASYWLRTAEKRAKLPKLERGLWHPYRRAWASERKHLPDIDTARAGGWRDLATMKQAYQQPDPATVLQVVENEPPGHTPDTPSEASGGASTA